MEKRLQLEMRNVVDQKLKEGFEVVQRGEVVLMKRGTTRIQVTHRNARVVVTYA